MTTTLVFGIGDVALADVGAGVHAMRYLRDHYDLPDTSYVHARTPSDALDADPMPADHLIVLEATDLGGEPGTVRVFQDSEVDEFLSSGKAIPGLAGLLDTARGRGSPPTHYAFIGIQPEQCGPGNAPSEIVRRSMPRAAGNAAALVYKWRRPEFTRASRAAKRREPAGI